MRHFTTSSCKKSLELFLCLVKCSISLFYHNKSNLQTNFSLHEFFSVDSKNQVSIIDWFNQIESNNGLLLSKMDCT